MAKVPFKLVDFAKNHGPTILKYSRSVAEGIPAVVDQTKKFKESREEKKQMNMHPREKLLRIYQLELLPELDKKNRSELINARLQVKQNMSQIEEEQQKEARVKKVLQSNSKEKAKWEAILVQINNRVAIKDYEEYRKIYNKPDHSSDYFEGFETQLHKFKKLINEESEERVITFLHEQTQINIEDIKKDF